ncbi:hypothetical protein HpHNI24_14930 [Helicobacter pylori]
MLDNQQAREKTKPKKHFLFNDTLNKVNKLYNTKIKSFKNFPF